MIKKKLMCDVCFYCLFVYVSKNDFFALRSFLARIPNATFAF